jgi:hypothetical protein
MAAIDGARMHSYATHAMARGGFLMNFTCTCPCPLTPLRAIMINKSEVHR